MIPERELKPREAKLRLLLLCKKLGLDPRVTTVGGEGLVADCTLYNKADIAIASGAGKGAHCELGAIAESLEHYLIESSRLYRPTQHTSIMIQKCPFLQDDWLLKSVSAGSLIPCYELQAVDLEAKINIPAILLTPTEKAVAEATANPALAFMAKYSSNSGTAIGCTENEALLHAINETIERHALSVYYLSICNLAPPVNLYAPLDTFLEDTFCENASLLHHSQRLEIFITQEFYGGYFCIALEKTASAGSLSIVGSGYASCAHVAVSRAVTEHLQCTHMQGAEEQSIDKGVCRMLSESSHLSKLLHPVPKRKMTSIHPKAIKLSVHSQIRNILINLKKSNRTVFYRTLINEPGLACAMQVYIPGLERFHLIRSGYRVVPQSALSGGARDNNVYL